MSFNPAGVFTLIASYFAKPGTTIRTEQHNPVFEDIAAAMSQVLVRDGRAPMVGPLNMNGFAITGVSPGSTPSSVATVSQAMPIGAVIDFAGTNAPAGWMLCYGQAISRTIYTDLFAIISTTYGAGDGSTTFNLPDLRGRGTAGKDNMGGVAANLLTPTYFANASVLGASGGSDRRPLSTANLPPYTPSGSIHTDVIGTIPVQGSGGDQVLNAVRYGGNNGGLSTLPITAYASSTWTGTAQGGSSTPFSVVQPTIIMNKIIRVSYDG